jgi:hypothetical protein
MDRPHERGSLKEAKMKIRSERGSLKEVKMKIRSATRREFLITTSVPIGAALPAWGQKTGATVANALEQGFRTLPNKDKPWVYWWWLNGNVTQKSITRDLEEMKKKGIGGFLMFDSRNYGVQNLPPPPAPMEFMSSEWRRLFKFAVSEAGRLGLEMSTNLSTNGGSLRSPWETGADAPKKLVWTAAEVRGPNRVTCELHAPSAPHFWEVAVLAVRRPGSQGPTAAAAVELSGEWRDAVTEVKDASAAVDKVLDITSSVDKQGRLSWDAPDGIWTLLRFACITMNGYEYDVDILNAKAVRTHFARMGEKFLADAGPLAGKTLTHFYNVSWEGASPTWTPGFEQDFLKFRGYDPRQYLPVLAGFAVKGPEMAARFLEDYSRTLSDSFRENCYSLLGQLCHQAGLVWHSESGGPWNRRRPLFAQADQLEFWGRNDMPQGEFWHSSRAGFTNCRRTAMAAHGYGRPQAAAESFTSMDAHWAEWPALLKPRADDASIDGINHFIWHTFDASPEEFGKPGIVYFAGSHLNPNVTWWEDAGAFLAYLGRCQLMHRQGRFVADVCVYTSDRNYQGWGRDERWSPNASLELGKGYTYDLVNTEVLTKRISVRDGGLALPDGMRYRLLVVDLEEEVIPPEALRKIVELARVGATVVLGQRRPERTPGLKDATARDTEVRQLAKELWADSGVQPFRRPLGKGKVIGGMTLDEVLQQEGVLPDFAGPWQYNHHRAGDTDIYFVVGQGSADCTFRVSGKEPEFWDPVTGRIRDAVQYRTTSDGRTVVPISLPENNGALFVVFRRPSASRHLLSVSGPAGGMEIQRRTQAGAEVCLWQGGQYVLQTSAKREMTVEAKLPEPIALSGPWEVRFAPGWGAPASVLFDRLIPWNEHPDAGIRYFSGTAVYRKTFELDAARAKGPVRLQLGEVRNTARVRVNGKPLGVVWTDPWSADLTGVVKQGRNDLEVEVTNLWVNRLIGDAALPADKRFTKTIVRRSPDYKGRNAHLRGYLATDRLEPSGLVGPVELEFGECHDVRL